MRSRHAMKARGRADLRERVDLHTCPLRRDDEHGAELAFDLRELVLRGLLLFDVEARHVERSRVVVSGAFGTARLLPRERRREERDRMRFVCGGGFEALCGVGVPLCAERLRAQVELATCLG